MNTSLKNNLLRNLSNLPGWRTKKKIVVFESDDWGSIRMPSAKVFERLLSAGLDLASGDSLRYNQFDTLAGEADLAALFETLHSVQDRNNHPCALTAVSVVANPDFEKIKNSGYKEYFYEPFTETLKRCTGCENAFRLWREGLRNRLFVPQFHGREHLNVSVWLKALQTRDSETLLAFENGCWGFIRKAPHQISYQAAFDLDRPDELNYQKEVIKQGLKLFGQLHGYKARFFVPPNGPFNNQLEKAALNSGITYLSTSKIQTESLGAGRTRKRLHYLGQKNRFGQHYLTRNCFFEPSLPGTDWVDACLSSVNIAFRWRKPAVISSHRVNYIGRIDPKNRDRGLKQLSRLLKSIVTKWPDVEFMTSDELGDLISTGSNRASN